MVQLDQRGPPGTCIIPELLEIIQTGLSQETSPPTRPLAGHGQVVNSIFKSTASPTFRPQHVPLSHGPPSVTTEASVCHLAGGSNKLDLMFRRIGGQ